MKNKKLISLYCLFLITGYTAIAQIKPVPPVLDNKKVAVVNNAAGILRYRITINGFTVNNPTADHILEVDGKGDEVFLYSFAQKFDKNNGNKIGDRTIRQSLVFGDINNDYWRREERIKAGSKPGEQGGLQKGDRYPGNEPWKQYNKPNNKTLPFVMAEGIMQRNELLLVIPSVWEYDGTSEFEQSLNSFASDITKVTLMAGCAVAGTLMFGPAAAVIVPFAAAIADVNGKQATQDPAMNREVFIKLDPPIPAFSTIVNKTLFGDAKDRPIGMEDKGSSFTYTPLGMQLTYNDLQNFARFDLGYGPGVLPLKFREAAQLQGDYTLYVQIEVTKDNQPLKNDHLFSPYEPVTAKKRYTLRSVNDMGALYPTTEGTLSLAPSRSNEQWEFVKIPNTLNQFYILGNRTSVDGQGKALDVYSHSMENGGKVVLWEQNKAANQRWAVTPVGDGSFTIIALESGKALSWNFNTNSLMQWENRGNPDQRWRIE